uniref:Uncharacterized protein n=1 Tax=Arundo donax TaxID=35708 RepID=A0A0A9C582_ARUDO
MLRIKPNEEVTKIEIDSTNLTKTSLIGSGLNHK